MDGARLSFLSSFSLLRTLASCSAAAVHGFAGMAHACVLATSQGCIQKKLFFGNSYRKSFCWYIHRPVTIEFCKNKAKNTSLGNLRHTKYCNKNSHRMPTNLLRTINLWQKIQNSNVTKYWLYNFLLQIDLRQKSSSILTKKLMITTIEIMFFSI
jgi:hypothetical protein